MDSLGWDSPSRLVDANGNVAAAVLPGIWRNQHHEHSTESGASSREFDLQQFGICISDRVNEMENRASNLNLPQQRGGADTILAKSGGGTSLSGQLSYSPLIIMNPLSCLMENFDPSHGFQLLDNVQFSVTDSIETIDCLLSATNSNTDASAEDEGISAIFSECPNLWNLDCRGAVSSGDSENEISHESKKQVIWHPYDLDDVLSQPSSNPYSIRHRESNSTPNSNLKTKQKEAKDGGNNRYFDLLQPNSSTTEGRFQLTSENPPKPKKARSENHHGGPSEINFQPQNSYVDEPDTEAIAHMKEMIYRAAAFRPVNLGLEVVEKPKRKNVKMSSDPQTVAARQRRERISERIRVLQRLVPGGSKMDTASMLDEAANYLRFLKSQVNALETLGGKLDTMNSNPSTKPLNHSFPIQNLFYTP